MNENNYQLLEMISQMNIDECQETENYLINRLSVIVKGFVEKALKWHNGEIEIKNGRYRLCNKFTDVLIKKVSFTNDEMKDHYAKQRGERYLFIKVNNRRFEPLVKSAQDWLVLYEAVKNNI
ncbi:MAG: hypothetical protein K6G39_07950 [Bacteroidales bacterium]|nr:hypothetical protein [Bacteroidales bacterium]